MYDLFWVATICGGVLAALVLFDATINIAYKIRDWWER